MNASIWTASFCDSAASTPLMSWMLAGAIGVLFFGFPCVVAWWLERKGF